MSGVLAAVLAGGAARRYGSEKSAARVGGVPMVQRVLAAAGAVADEVVLVAGAPVAGAETVPRIPDRVEGQGPLGGLHAALHEARERGRARVLLLPCDLPLVPEALLRALLEAQDGSEEGTPAPAVAPARPDGSAQVLCAVWGVEVLDEVEARLGGDDRSLQALFRAVGGRTLDERELPSLPPGSLLNVNTPADRARAQAAARARGREG